MSDPCKTLQFLPTIKSKRWERLFFGSSNHLKVSPTHWDKWTNVDCNKYCKYERIHQDLMMEHSFQRAVDTFPTGLQISRFLVKSPPESVRCHNHSTYQLQITSVSPIQILHISMFLPKSTIPSGYIRGSKTMPALFKP